MGVGLIQFIYAGNIPLERGDSDPFGDDPSFSPISQDFLKKAYIAKRGSNSLSSNNDSIEIKLVGGIYGGVDLGVSKRFDKKIDEAIKLANVAISNVEEVEETTQETKDQAVIALKTALKAETIAREALDKGRRQRTKRR